VNTLKEILYNNNWSGTNCSLTTDKASTHNYVEGFYENSFSSYRDKKVKVLEIGIASGTSLLLWDEYFVNNTGVYGIDINSSDITNEVEKRERINTIIGNAYDQKLTETLPIFDIIIDDGPHTLESMVSFIELYLPKLNSNGIMVIEDIQSLDWMSELIEVFNESKKDTDECEVVDLRESIGRYDDLMFIIRRK
jgi:fibrillarin-like rRNA methylase